MPTLEQRLVLVRKLTSLGFLAGILLSHKLWLSERFFPLLPVADSLPILGEQEHNGLLCVLLVLLGLNVWKGRPGMNALILAVLALLLLQDQNRWQPWVYLYTLLLLPFSFRSIHQRADLTYFKLVLIGVYAWSGIHKLNPSFLDTVFFEILTGLFHLESTPLLEAIKSWGYLIPIAEISIALGLLMPKFRNHAVYAAVAMHVLILLYLSPVGIGANTVVYPWNLTMIGLVVLLFYRDPQRFELLNAASYKGWQVLGMLLVWLMPLLNFWGYWDHYLSFSLYSGKTDAYYIVVGEQELHKIDPRLQDYFLQVDGLQGGQIIHVNKWALAELNVPFYPETRILKQLSNSFCNKGIAQGQLYFLEFELPLEKQRFYRFTCEDVVK